MTVSASRTWKRSRRAWACESCATAQDRSGRCSAFARGQRMAPSSPARCFEGHPMNEEKTLEAPRANGIARILIVDDHPIVREGLAARINRQADLKVCGEAEDV